MNRMLSYIMTIVFLLSFADPSEAVTLKVVPIDGDTLVSGTYTPEGRSFNSYYTEEEILNAKFSAERSTKVLLLGKNGEIYYPCNMKGVEVSVNQSHVRYTWQLTPEQEKQKKEGKRFSTWIALLPLIGKVIKVEGDVYPGYAGLKGIFIKSIEVEQEVER